MKKIFVALSMLAFLAACDDSSSASAGQNDEPAVESSSSSSGKVTEPAEVTSSSSEKAKQSNSSSSVDTISSSSLQGDKKSSSSGQNEASSSSLKAESSSSVGNSQSSSSKDPELAEGFLTDSRDGQTYKTVTIGTQTWMADNLNYETENSYCYDDDPSNCSKYGRLYTWAAAKTVCPEGWHLPDTTEWNTLFTAVGGSSTAGAKLKSQTGWTAYYGITNEDSFGFSALPAGFRFDYGHYINEGDYAYFWSSTEYSSYGAYYVSLDYNGDYAYLGNDGKSNGFSVRCVKD